MLIKQSRPGVYQLARGALRVRHASVIQRRVVTRPALMERKNEKRKRKKNKGKKRESTAGRVRRQYHVCIICGYRREARINIRRIARRRAQLSFAFRVRKSLLLTSRRGSVRSRRILMQPRNNPASRDDVSKKIAVLAMNGRKYANEYENSRVRGFAFVRVRVTWMIIRSFHFVARRRTHNGEIYRATRRAIYRSDRAI